MTKKEAIALASDWYDTGSVDFNEFKAMIIILFDSIALAEREACVKVCRDKMPWGNMADDWAAKLLESAAKEIEMRSNNVD